jgi:ligand-binding sensor domain-containing protein
LLKKNLYTIFFLSCFFYGRAQNINGFILSQLNEDNGLSDNHVNTVLKDKQGLVWIGTQDGLNLLDGSSIKIFKHTATDPASISNNFINAIKEDAAGNIWIATSLGLNCYDKKLQRFFNYYLAASPYSTSAIIFSLAMDSSVIWCGTDGGLFKFNRSNHSSIFLECGKTEPAGNRRYCNKVNNVLLDENNICWLCTSEGLWSYDTKSNSFKKQISAANDTHYNPLFLTALNDVNDKLWVSCWQNGLKLFDKKSGQVITYFSADTASSIYSIAKISPPGNKNLLWLNGRLNAFDPATGVFFQYQKPLLFPEYPIVKGNYVSSDNWVWLFTDKGLYIYNPQRQLFNNQVFTSGITSQEMVLSTIKNNLLACGQGDSILLEYNSNQKLLNNFSNIIFNNRPYKKKAGAALSLIKENDNRWWMGTSEGIVHFDLNSKKVTWFEHKENDSNSLPRNFVNHIFFDSKKILWVFPWREGIWQLDTLSGKATRIFDGFSINSGVKKKLVIADAAEDELGNIWLCDLDEGIILYERASNHFSQPFTNRIGAGLHTDRIYKHNGFFYTVANNHIIKWKDKSNCSSIYFPAEFEKAVYDFVADQQGNWWFATKNGLIYFNEEKNIFKRFTTIDGLYSNDLDATLYCMPDGKIVIGGLLFITLFDPQKLLQASQIIPQLLLTKFASNGNRVAYTPGNTVSFSYASNNIIFEWALPDYNSPLRNRYYCQLKGIDSSWRYVGNKGEVQYANLSPGTYTILLRAANTNGDFANENISIHFIIHPPFWKTIGFLFAILVIITLLMYWLFKRRLNAAKKKIALQQQMNELEMKALRAQMNPHFIFNSLNSIQECIVSKNTDAAYNYLSQFSKLVRRILENSGKETVPLKEEQELMQWYLSLEQLRFTDEFTFSIKNNCSNPLIEIPSMIIQPFIENALWHGLINRKGKKIIQLIFNDDKEGVNIQIIDNGIGRKAAALLPQRTGKQSMGLHITKERLQHYSHASSIEIIDLFDDTAIACGTKVIIHLPNN